MAIGIVNNMNALGFAVVKEFIPVQFLLNDQFTTEDLAPLTTPRTCEPGPGSLTVVDTANHAGVTGGKLIFTGAPTSGSLDPRLYSALELRNPGKVFKFSVKSTNILIGFGISNAIKDGFCFFNGRMYVFNDGQQVSDPYLTINTTVTYEFTIIQRLFGYQLFIKGGAWTTETLVFSYYKKSITASVNVYLSQFMGAGNTELSNVKVYNVNGKWSTQFPNALSHYLAPDANQSFTHTSNCIIEGSLTLLAAAVVNIYLRRTDANNCIICRITQGGPGTAKIIKKEAGVETELATVSPNFSAGTENYFTIICSGNLIRLFTSSRSIEITDSFNNTVFNGLVDTKLLGLAVYDTSQPSPTELTVSKKLPIWLLATGDSKTALGTDSFKLLGYQGRLCEFTEAAKSRGANYETKATPGYTVAQWKAQIDTWLSQITRTMDYVIVNIGVNDAGTLPDQTTWQTNYAYGLDAIHTKWPNANIYYTKVWMRNQDANCNTIDDIWIPNVVNSRPWAILGMDERITIKGVDDGNTNTVDGTHYSNAGYDAAASAYKLDMGL